VKEVTETGAPEVPLTAVCCMTASAVEEASIAYRRMTMLETSVEEATTDDSYAAMLALSGSAAIENAVGNAKEMPTLGSETFGARHGANVQEVPIRATEVPSGHTRASIGHTIGCEGCSTAFRYTNPPIPITTISRIPPKRLFIC